MRLKPKKTKFELRLGLPHLVVCLGVAMGFMLCSFFIGYSSGREQGFEVASQDALVKSVRLPISEEFDSGTDTEQVSNLYARLQDKPEKPDVAPTEGKLPELTRKERVVEQAPPVLKEKEEKPATLKDIVERAGSENAVFEEDKKSEQNLKDLDQQAPPETVAALGDAVRVLGADADKKRELPKIPETLVAPEESMIITEQKESEASLGTLLKSTKNEEKTLNPDTLQDTTRSVKRVPVEKGELAPLNSQANSQVVQKKEFQPLVKEPAVVTPRKSVPVTKSVQKGWYAQIAAPEEKAVAEKLAGQLRSSGFPAVIEEADVRGSRYYRVLAGPESSSTMANRLISQLSREPYVKGKPFLRPVK